MTREPAPALERLIARLRESGADEVAGWYEALLADTPDARKVRDWFKKHGRPNASALRMMPGALDWECAIWSLVHITFALTPTVSARERAGKDKRTSKATTAASKALALAAVLEDEAGPLVPSVLALFHPDRAVDILRAVPPARYMLRRTGYSAEPHDGYQRTDNPVEDGLWQDPAAKLARHFGGAWGSAEAAQLFPDLLRRLADYIEKNAERELTMAPRLPRKKQPDRTPSPKKKPKKTTRQDALWADSRAFARALSGSFMDDYGERPWAVIAALVGIRFPDMEDPPDDRAIRGWCRDRSKK